MRTTRRTLLFGLLTALAVPGLFFPIAALPQEPQQDSVLPGPAGDPKAVAQQAGQVLARARSAVEKKDWDLAADAVLNLLELPPGTQEKVAETLDRYLMMDRVEIEDATAAWGILSLQGPGSSAIVARSPPPRP